MTFLLKDLLGSGDIGQREDLGDQRLDVALLDMVHEIGEDFRFQHRAAEEAQVLQIQGAQVEFHHFATDGTRDGVAPLVAENIQQLWPLRATHQINDHLDTVAFDHIGQCLLTQDDLIGAEIAQGVGLGRTGDGNDVGAMCLRQLNGRGADAP